MADQKKAEGWTNTVPEYNPAVWDVMFFGFKFTARLLKETGLVELLEKKVAQSTTEIDDKAIRIVKQILDILAE
jgi:hypothetical protein